MRHSVYFGKVTPVKSIYLLNVVVKQKILIKTQKTKQATYCPVIWARRAGRHTW